MQWRSLLLFGLVSLCALTLAPGCAEKATDPVSLTSDEHPPPFGGVPTTIGAYTSIAWPFGSSEHPNDWYGEESWREKTPGGTIHACGRWINSHTGADFYARDLSRNDGTTAGKNVYAGFSGRVVKANWSDCYGNCVVIYDHSRRLAVRYAHLQSITVSQGQWVNIRQYIGKAGNTGCGSFSPHLHLAVYENIDHFIGGDPNRPVIPIVCDSDHYACRVYFHS